MPSGNMVIPWEEVFMQGIYLITNTINGKKYIGQTVSFSLRKEWYKKELREKNTRPIIKAMLEFGEENFTFEFIEPVKRKEDLTTRENFHIKRLGLDREENGYNYSKIGENNNRSVLTEREVLIARDLFHVKNMTLAEINAKEEFLAISSSALRKAIKGATWKNVKMPDVERSGRIYSTGSPRSKLDKSQVAEIRARYSQGETVKSIHRQSFSNVSLETIERIVKNKTHKT